jgi:hypothetical protein
LLGKTSLGQTLLGKMSLGKMLLGEMSLGKTLLGKTLLGKQTHQSVSFRTSLAKVYFSCTRFSQRQATCGNIALEKLY